MTDKLRDAAQLALEWIEDASVVLSHVSTAIQGGVGAEAEGVGGCSVKVIDTLSAALAQQDAQAVPSGYKLVPVEPTTEMKERSQRAMLWAGWDAAYAELLNAAPTTPAQENQS